MKIGVYYASTSGNTEVVTDYIVDCLGADMVEPKNIADVGFAGIQDYELLMFGTPTWDYGHLQSDWEECWSELEDLDLNGVVVALYGLGDQYGYPEWYLDAMGIIYDKLKEKGVRVVGRWPNQGYDFEKSKALIDDGKYFVGLALDEESQGLMTKERVTTWSCNVLEEYAELID